MCDSFTPSLVFGLVIRLCRIPQHLAIDGLKGLENDPLVGSCLVSLRQKA